MISLLGWLFLIVILFLIGCVAGTYMTLSWLREKMPDCYTRVETYFNSKKQ